MVHGVAARWEWRTFGGQFGEAEARFAALSPEHVQESDELYLLSLKSDASVKIREGLIDVKLLERVNADGLEQWKPAIKEAFPLSADHVLAVMKALGMATAQLARAAYALDQLIDELVTQALIYVPSAFTSDALTTRSLIAWQSCRRYTSTVLRGERSASSPKTRLV